MWVLIPLLVIIAVVGYVVALRYDRYGQQNKKDRQKHKSEPRKNNDDKNK